MYNNLANLLFAKFKFQLKFFSCWVIILCRFIAFSSNRVQRTVYQFFWRYYNRKCLNSPCTVPHDNNLKSEIVLGTYPLQIGYALKIPEVGVTKGSHFSFYPCIQGAYYTFRGPVVSGL